MSNYTKTTNFASKDNLSPGNPLKIVKGTEIDTEFNNIATAVATKTDNASANITGGSITGITDLAVADGGTGASTATAALNNLLPSQTGNANKYLQTDGTNASWDAVSLSTSDITGTLPVANGGTGVTSSTGTGSVVLSNSPTLVTPALGTPSSGTATNLTGLPISTGVSGLGTGVATFLGTPSSANLASAVTDETGSGALVFANSPTLVTPTLGTPASATLTNATGLPIATGVSGLGTGVATALAVNVGSSGAPLVNGGVLGTPSSGTATNLTGLPISTGVSGLGTGVATALAVNVGSAGAPVVNGGALGTPSSGTATNLTGLPLSTGVTGTLPVANGGTGQTTATAAFNALAPSQATNSGKYLTTDGTNTSWATVTSGSGDVVGPSSSTDNALVRFDTTTGKLVQNSVGILSDTGAISGLTDISASGSVTLSGGTANGVTYLNGSKVLTSGSALTFDGTTTFLLNASAAGSQANFRVQTDTTGAVANGYFNINGTDYFRIYTTSSETGLRNLQNTPIYFSVNNTEGMRLTSTGLGIGTSSPAYKLDVAGIGRLTTAINSNATSLILNNSNSAAGGVGVSIDGYSGNTSNKLAQIVFGGAGATGGNIDFLTSANGSSYVQQMRLDTSGNLGLGVTPSAWGGGQVGLQVKNASLSGYSNSAYVMANTYYDGTNEKYIASSYAGKYAQASGAHIWYNAPSGTAGNAISFTQALTLDASGNLGLGATSIGEGNFQISKTGLNTGITNVLINASFANAANTTGLTLGYRTDETTAVIAPRTATGNVAFYNYNGAWSETARFTNTGNLLVGTTGATGKITVSTSGNTYGIYSENTNTATTSNYLFWGYASSASRFVVYGNGGIANYQANNVNLSDRREKTNFAPAKSYLDVICAIPVQTFNFIDQAENDIGLTLGVIAQDVQAVAPELVTENNWGTEEEPKMRLSIYQTDLQYALMKALQEQQAIIQQLQADVAALKGN